ncbi:MAG: thioesterase [Clostridium sp.]|nr:thioesterase [Clostridium sp.]
MYSYESRIRYSELDETGRLRLESLLDYFQDCSTFQSEDLGLGVEYLRERNMVWVMSSWQIVAERYPKLGEVVTVGTFPYEFKGFVGYRNFLMLDKEGKRLAYANTIWSLLNTATGKPAKPPQEMMEKYVLEPKIEMDYAPRKIRFPEDAKEGEPVLIKAHHLDVNHHVNNGQFVRIAMDSMGENLRVRQLRAEYKKQVMLGEELIPYTAALEDGKTAAALKDREGTVCCVVEVQEERK